MKKTINYNLILLTINNVFKNMKMNNRKRLSNLIMKFSKPIKIINKLKQQYKENLIVKKPIKQVLIQNTN